MKQTKYVFFIGGSGARAYKAFLHLCAAGVVKGDLVNVALLDADTHNAACAESCDLFRLYSRKRGMLDAARFSTPAFHCDIHMYGGAAAISPIYKNVKRLEEISGGNDVRQRVMKWFYTEKERDQELTNGFYAHPNMGCIFFQDIGKVPDMRVCLEEMMSDLRNETQVRVAIVGSVFGGTGAAGIPSILKIIEERCEIERVPRELLHVCGVLIAPYFSISETQPDTEGIRIDSKNFYGNTKAALSYYRFAEHFEKTYLIGQDELELLNPAYADGGAEQANKPHIVEVFSAMAVKHFLEGSDGGASILGRVIERRDPQAQITWSDFDGDIYMWMDMLRTQSILASEIYPDAFDYVGKEKKQTYQWYKTYRVGSADGQAVLKEMRDYTSKFWEWMQGLTHKYEDYSGELIPDGGIALCDVDAVTRLSAQSAHDGAKEPSRARTWQKRQASFHKLVDTAQKIEFVADKLIVILSILGVVPMSLSGLSCADLFIKLFGLAAHLNVPEAD